MMRQSYDYPQAMPTFILSSDLLVVTLLSFLRIQRTKMLLKFYCLTTRETKSDSIL
jgi:hypothetical protein